MDVRGIRSHDTLPWIRRVDQTMCFCKAVALISVEEGGVPCRGHYLIVLTIILNRGKMAES